MGIASYDCMVCKAGHARACPVRTGKGVVDVEIDHARQTFHQLCLAGDGMASLDRVFLFMATDVVEHQNLSGFEGLDGRHGLFATDVVHPIDTSSKQAPKFSSMAEGAGEVRFAGT